MSQKALRAFLVAVMQILTTMVASLAVIVLAAFLYLTRFLGHSISVTSLGFFHIFGLSCKTPLRIITIGKLNISFKRPSRADPSWATITIRGFEYKDTWCHLSMEYCLTKIWLFPVFYRFSFGPWIDATVDGVAVHVYESRNTPALLDKGRNHLVASALNGETVRIGLISTRFFFGRNLKVPMSYASENEIENGGTEWERQVGQFQGEGQHQGRMHGGQEGSSYGSTTKKDERKTGYERDDVRIRFALEQWHMVTFNNGMYTFGDLQGELRRSWLDDRGSLVLIMQNVAWTKLPHTDHPQGKGRGKLWEIVRAMWYFPSGLFTFARDPLAFFDIRVGQCDVTFCDFRLRDAEMLKQGSTRLKQEHFALEKRYPGVINDFAWDMFVHGVHDLCKE